MTHLASTAQWAEVSLVGRYEQAVAARETITSPGDPPPTKRYHTAHRTPLHWPGPGAPEPPGGDLGRLSRWLLAFAPTRVEHLSPTAISVIIGRPGEVSGSARYAGGSNALRRSAPSGGAFYPGEVYLAWNGSPDLPAGVYHYDQVHHALELLRPGAPAPRLAAALDDDLRQPNALVLTCRPWKNTSKYTTFSYQITAMDLGVLTAQALTVLPAARVHFSFDGTAVEDLLGIDGSVESGYAVVELQGPAVPAVEPLGELAPGLTERGLEVDRRTVPSVHPSALALHAACRSDPLRGKRTAADPGTAGPQPGRTVRLPAPPPPDLIAALSRRRAAPSMRPGLTVEQLAGVLAHAGTDLATDAVPTGLRPTLWCAVNTVAGLPGGGYRYDPVAHTLIATGGNRSAGAMTRATGNVAGRMISAGATIYVVAGPDAVPDRLAPWSYRLLLMLAGTVVQKACLAGAAVGAATRPILSFLPDEVRGLLDLPPQHTTLVQVHIGAPGPCPGLLSMPVLDDPTPSQR
ncbi:hypothetical protein ACFY2Q_29255 [Micromonospora sp. NPDC000316]|uniref:hypothetical protein n=1 Tax=Micromonospora sp. NPDC000316 TaxID=3364216 RepID=UPI003692E0E7